MFTRQEVMERLKNIAEKYHLALFERVDKKISEPAVCIILLLVFRRNHRRI